MDSRAFFGRVRKISPPTGIESPERPARSESLYRLSYHFHSIAIPVTVSLSFRDAPFVP